MLNALPNSSALLKLKIQSLNKSDDRKCKEEDAHTDQEEINFEHAERKTN
jgi:hypothetical protein